MSVAVINATKWKKLYYFVKMTMWDVATTTCRHKAGVKKKHDQATFNRTI